MSWWRIGQCLCGCIESPGTTATTMMTVAVVLALTLADCRWRRAPNWLTFPLIIAGVLGHGWRQAVTVLGVAAFVWLAGFPGGDVKGSAAMAAWVPPLIMISGLAGAFFATLALMSLTRRARWAFLADGPWLLCLAISLGYATLLQVATPLGGGR